MSNVLKTFLFTQIQTVIGFVLFGIAFFIYQHSKKITAQRSRKANGVVIKNIKSTSHYGVGADSHKSTAYYLLVRYMIFDGREIESRSSYGTGRVKYPENSHVIVWYDPEKPESFHLDNRRDFIRMPVILLSVMGASFIAMGVVFGYLVTVGIVR